MEEVDTPVDFLMVVGDGRDDEVIFRWANDLSAEKAVKNVSTVSLGSRNTEAGATLTQGVTGMFYFYTFSHLSCLRVEGFLLLGNPFTNFGTTGVLSVLQRLSKIS